VLDWDDAQNQIQGQRDVAIIVPELLLVALTAHSL